MFCAACIIVLSVIIFTGRYSSQEPQLRDLMTHVAYEAPTMWRQVGIQLRIKTATLNAFKTQEDDPTELYIQVFEQWKKEQKVPYTWTTIINTLRAVKEREVASDIVEWLRTREEKDYFRHIEVILSFDTTKIND